MSETALAIAEDDPIFESDVIKELVKLPHNSLRPTWGVLSPSWGASWVGEVGYSRRLTG